MTHMCINEPIYYKKNIQCHNYHTNYIILGIYIPLLYYLTDIFLDHLNENTYAIIGQYYVTFIKYCFGKKSDIMFKVSELFIHTLTDAREGCAT